MKRFGIVGQPEGARTTLMQQLVNEIGARGHSVSVIKRAPAVFDVDQPEKDSHRHRQAGATEVLLAARKGFALMHELREAQEPSLDALLSKLAPVDLVLIEGYTTAGHAKIEILGDGRADTENASVKALVGTAEVAAERPIYAPEDIGGITDFILSEVGL